MSTIAAIVKPDFISVATTLYLISMSLGGIVGANFASMVAVNGLSSVWSFAVFLSSASALVVLTLYVVDQRASRGEMNLSARRLRLHMPRWWGTAIKRSV